MKEGILVFSYETQRVFNKIRQEHDKASVTVRIGWLVSLTEGNTFFHPISEVQWKKYFSKLVSGKQDNIKCYCCLHSSSYTKSEELSKSLATGFDTYYYRNKGYKVPWIARGPHAELDGSSCPQRHHITVGRHNQQRVWRYGHWNRRRRRFSNVMDILQSHTWNGMSKNCDKVHV